MENIIFCLLCFPRIHNDSASLLFILTVWFLIHLQRILMQVNWLGGVSSVITSQDLGGCCLMVRKGEWAASDSLSVSRIALSLSPIGLFVCVLCDSQSISYASVSGQQNGSEGISPQPEVSCVPCSQLIVPRLKLLQFSPFPGSFFFSSVLRRPS